MNRTLLLIVCDFLLLSLLALADFKQTGKPMVSEKDSQNLVEPDEFSDDAAMMDLLASALTAEQTAQSELEEKLAQAENDLSALESSRTEMSEDLREKEEAIAERERLLAERETLLAEARAETDRIAAERTAAEERAMSAQEERDRLSAERAAAQAEALELASTVKQLSAKAETSTAELKQRTAELARLEAELAQREKRLQEAELQKTRAEADRQRLTAEVQSVEREKQLLNTTLESARETISSERREKEQLREQTETLTEGVSRLAEASTDITEEVRNLRPKTNNEIYEKVNSNRVTIEFKGARSGLFGENEFESSVATVITQVNGRPFAWIHLSQTPFADPERRKFLNRIEAYLQVNESRFRIPQLGVLEQDPRILFLPLTNEIVEGRGVETFPTSKTPFRFEDMVVIDLPDSRFGESGFQIDTEKPGWLEIDQKVFSRLFGEFSPSAGNLAFTRTGDFLGIVTAAGEAWIAETVRPGARISFGENFTRAQLEDLP